MTKLRAKPDPDAAKREMLMLWVLLTANPKYHPTASTDANTLLNQIEDAVAKALGVKKWEFPFYDNDRKGNPLNFIKMAIETEKNPSAGEEVPKKGSRRKKALSAGPYSRVANDFRIAPNSPWPGGGAHPGIEELVSFLQISSGEMS